MLDSRSANRDYESMSREELVAMIGGDVDPTTTRDELIVMAMETDTNNMM